MKYTGVSIDRYTWNLHLILTSRIFVLILEMCILH